LFNPWIENAGDWGFARRGCFLFSLKLRRDGAIGHRPRRIGLGFANVTVFAGSAPNEHTVTGVNAAAHIIDFASVSSVAFSGLSTLLSFAQRHNSWAWFLRGQFMRRTPTQASD
jgi:hypothetical protein